LSVVCTVLTFECCGLRVEIFSDMTSKTLCVKYDLALVLGLLHVRAGLGKLGLARFQFDPLVCQLIRCLRKLALLGKGCVSVPEKQTWGVRRGTTDTDGSLVSHQGKSGGRQACPSGRLAPVGDSRGALGFPESTRGG